MLVSTSKDGSFRIWDMTAAMHQFALEGMVSDHEAYVEAQHAKTRQNQADRRRQKQAAKEASLLTLSGCSRSA